MAESARERVLGRVRQAISGPLHLPAAPAVSWPRQPEEADREALVRAFAAELEALAGKFQRVPRSRAAEAVGEVLAAHGAKEFVAWDEEHLPAPGLLAALEAAGYTRVPATLPAAAPERAARLNELGRVPVGLTGVVGAIAQVGAVVVAGGVGRARLASLLPPVHIALLTPADIFPTLEAWLRAQALDPLLNATSSLTLIAGPSRTADIEQKLALGVHGPREVIAICLD